MLVQPNGRVVVAGGGGPASSFCVVRLRAANGTLDPTFGSGGKRIVDFGTDDESVYGAALQPDGKIVLAGDSRLQVAVVRLKANGALDTTFDGDGKKTASAGARSAAPRPWSWRRTASSCSAASPGPRAATSRSRA